MAGLGARNQIGEINMNDQNPNIPPELFARLVSIRSENVSPNQSSIEMGVINNS